MEMACRRLRMILTRLEALGPRGPRGDTEGAGADKTGDEGAAPGGLRKGAMVAPVRTPLFPVLPVRPTVPCALDSDRGQTAPRGKPKSGWKLKVSPSVGTGNRCNFQSQLLT